MLLKLEEKKVILNWTVANKLMITSVGMEEDRRHEKESERDNAGKAKK